MIYKDTHAQDSACEVREKGRGRLGGAIALRLGKEIDANRRDPEFNEAGKICC